MASFDTGRKLLRVPSLETEEDRLREEYGGKNWANSWSAPFETLPPNVKEMYADALKAAETIAKPKEEPVNIVCYLQVEDSLENVLKRTRIFSSESSDSLSLPDHSGSEMPIASLGADAVALPKEELDDNVCYLQIEDSLENVLQSTRIFSSDSEGSPAKPDVSGSEMPDDFLCIAAERSLYKSSFFSDDDENAGEWVKVVPKSTVSTAVQCFIPERKSFFRRCLPILGMIFALSLTSNVYFLATM